MLGEQTVPAARFHEFRTFLAAFLLCLCVFLQAALRGAFVTVFPPLQAAPPLSFYFVIVTFHQQVDKQTVMCSCVLLLLNNSFDAAVKATPSSSNRARLLKAGGRGRLLGAGAACGCAALTCLSLWPQ